MANNDPTWEDCVNDILIPGDPGAIDDAGLRWQSIFAALEDVKHTLDQEVLLKESWSGPAADAYKNAIASICQMIKQFNDDNSYINSKLFEASYDLQQAMTTMPIPTAMVPTILQKRHEFETQDSYWPVPQDQFLRAELGLKPDDQAAQFFLNVDQGTWYDFTHNFTEHTEAAVRIYKTLDQQHGDTAATLPTGNLASGGLDTNPTVPGLTSGPGGGGVGNFGGLGGSGGGAGSLSGFGGPGGHGPGPGAGATRLDGLGPGAGVHRIPDPTTGLSGVDGSGFTGADSGLGGSGGGGLPGLGRASTLGTGAGGVAGLSPTAVAAAMKGIGSPVSPLGGAAAGTPPGMMGGGMGGMGGAQAAGTRNPGLVGAGGPGAHGAGGDTAQNTWLQEDDDVWGSDSGAPPPLLT